MNRLELWFPAKPYIVTQAWGIYNSIYLQFGFNRHNGIDFLPGIDGLLYAPCKLTVTMAGYQEKGAGNYVQGMSEPVEVNGKTCIVELTFMHLESFNVKIGDILDIGDIIGVPGSSGFSTGPHTHLSCRRLNMTLGHIDENDASNTFDQSSFFNGFYAIDKGRVISLMQQVIVLLQQLYLKLSK